MVTINGSYRFTVKINGRPFACETVHNANIQNSDAFKVIKGDIVEIPNEWSRVILLPYSYDATIEYSGGMIQ